MELNEKLNQLKVLLTQVDELMPSIKKDIKHGENNLLNDLFVVNRVGNEYIMTNRRKDSNTRKWDLHCKNRDFVNLHLHVQKAIVKIDQIQSLQLDSTPVKVKTICKLIK